MSGQQHSGWTVSPFHDVAEIVREAVNPNDLEESTPYVGLEHIDGEGFVLDHPIVRRGDLASTKFRFDSDHILYGKLRPYLRKIATPNFAGICSTDILPIRPKEGLEKRYLYHYLRSPELISLATTRSSGANLPRLSPSTLEEFPIRYPDALDEQRRIATILDKADAIRRKRKQAIELTEELLRSVFLDMFGDPVLNPKGWDTVELDEFVRNDDTINYGVVQPGPDVPAGVPIVRVGDFSKGQIAKSNLKRISQKIEAKYRRSRLRGDEILVACVGSIGQIALADKSLAGANIVRAVARVPIKDGDDREYLAAYLQSSFAQDYFRRETRTVSQPTLNIGHIKKTPVLLPPKDLRDSFRQVVGNWNSTMSKMRDTLALSEELFESLASSAFQGLL